jgi:hypothetical protein
MLSSALGEARELALVIEEAEQLLRDSFSGALVWYGKQAQPIATIEAALEAEDRDALRKCCVLS